MPEQRCEGCGWSSLGLVSECEGCGERRATATLDRAALVARVVALEDDNRRLRDHTRRRLRSLRERAEAAEAKG